MGDLANRWSAASHAPAAFTTAALVPFLLYLVALGRLVRRESGSTTAALAAIAAFSLSAVHIEAAWWFYASTFTWALLGTFSPGCAYCDPWSEY